MGLEVGREKTYHSLSLRSHCPSLLFSEKSFFYTCTPHSLTHARSLQEANKAFWSSIGHSASSELSKIKKKKNDISNIPQPWLMYLHRHMKKGLGDVLKNMYVYDGWWARDSTRIWCRLMCLCIFGIFLFQALSGSAVEGFWNFRTQSSSFK